MPLEIDDLYKLIGVKEAQLLAFQQEYRRLEEELKNKTEELEKLRPKEEKKDGKLSALQGGDSHKG